jgi:hypothetical protein
VQLSKNDTIVISVKRGSSPCIFIFVVFSLLAQPKKKLLHVSHMKREGRYFLTFSHTFLLFQKKMMTSKKKHRSRDGRSLARKCPTGYVALAAKFQVELDDLTPQMCSELNIEKKDLCWVCAKCLKPTEHDPRICPEKCAQLKKPPKRNIQSFFSTTAPNSLAQTSTDQNMHQVPMAQGQTTVQNLTVDAAAASSAPASEPMPNLVSCPNPQSKQSIFEKMANVSYKCFAKFIHPLLVDSNNRYSSEALRKNKIMSWRFPFPLPHLLANDDLRSCPVMNLLKDSDLFVLDYQLFFPDFFPPNGLLCECGNKLHRNGFQKHCRAERGFGLRRIFVCQEYICNDCKNPAKDKKTSFYNSLSPNIIKQLDSYVRSHLDFVVEEGYIVSSTDVSVIKETLLKGGNSLEGIQKISSVAIEEKLSAAEKTRLLYCKHLRNSLTPMVLEESIVQFAPVFILTATIVSQAFNREISRMMPWLQASFIFAALLCRVLQQDMSYPFGHAGSLWGICGLFHLLNMNGEVVAGQGFTRQSTMLAVPLYKQIAQWKDEKETDNKCPVELVWTDHPKNDEYAVQSGFGSNAKVYKDVFHVLQCVGKCVRMNHELRPAFMSKASQCVFEYFFQDMETLRKSLFP